MGRFQFWTILPDSSNKQILPSTRYLLGKLLRGIKETPKQCQPIRRTNASLVPKENTIFSQESEGEIMLSRAFSKPRKSGRDGDNNYNNSKSGSILEYSDDCVVGFVDDLPLVFCGGSESKLSLREILRASVGVMGESQLGMTEKVVMLDGQVYAVKRFRKVRIGRSEFSKKVEGLAGVGKRCEYLVPVTAYLYAKRIKFVLCHYYPMGSLADLLAGGRECGHTALNWNQRFLIAQCIARGIAFIHMQPPSHGKSMQMNVHGNIKASNVLINVNFTACLSGYGFTQLAESESEEDSFTWQPKPLPRAAYCNKLCQKSDIYNFGVILLDLLGNARAPGLENCIVERKEQIRGGGVEFSEFVVEGNERKQAMDFLDFALACKNKIPEARPSIEQVLRFLGDAILIKY